MSDIRIGDKVKPNLVSEVSDQLHNLLPQDEAIVGVFSASNIKPLLEAIVVTDGRLVGVTRDFSSGWKYVAEIHKADVTAFTAERTKLSSFTHTPLRLQLRNGKVVKYADVRKGEADEIVKLLTAMSGSPERISSIMEKRHAVVAKQFAENKAHEKQAADAEVAKWKALVTGKVNGASIREVQNSCRDGEMPEFIIGEGINGVLAAFSDRCIVIKKGVGTSLMAGSLGGGRTAVFPYQDITGIEYNSGIMSGVLEILTASYTGKTTNSPWTYGNDRSAHMLSNTLPWTKAFYNQVRPKIEWLKQKVQESKRLQPATAASSLSTADELAKLADLHKQGILSNEEFQQAKQKILNGR